MTKEWRILSTLDDTCDQRAHLLRKAEWSAHVWRCHYWSRKTNDKWPLDPTTTKPHLSFPSCLETRTNPKRSSCFFRSPLTIALHVCKKSGKAWFGDVWCNGTQASQVQVSSQRKNAWPITRGFFWCKVKVAMSSVLLDKSLHRIWKGDTRHIGIYRSKHWIRYLHGGALHKRRRISTVLKGPRRPIWTHLQPKKNRLKTDSFNYMRTVVPSNIAHSGGSTPLRAQKKSGWSAIHILWTTWGWSKSSCITAQPCCQGTPCVGNSSATRWRTTRSAGKAVLTSCERARED